MKSDHIIPGIPMPPSLTTYLEVLGEDDTLKLIMELGGAPIYFTENPKTRSRIAGVVGHDKAAALARELGMGSHHLPNAKRWAAYQYRRRNVPDREIARLLRVSDRTVASWLKRHTDSAQAELPF
ncbi:MAG: helix-turn-helix domain-containing protein [Pseudomonadota bacterium]